MFIQEELSKYSNIRLYVDMDGVIAYYNLGCAHDFDLKRPLMSNINKIKEMALLYNIELYILSVCKLDKEVDQKNNWLDKYAPIFKKENRIIISKQSNPNLTSKELKYNYLINNIDKKYTNILIDDDNSILKYINDKTNDIILYQDSILVD